MKSSYSLSVWLKIKIWGHCQCHCDKIDVIAEDGCDWLPASPINASGSQLRHILLIIRDLPKPIVPYMSALIDAPVSHTRKASDPAIISTPIASSSLRSATPPSLASSSSITSEEDEIDKNSVIITSKPNAAPPPPVPEISTTLQVPFYFSFSPLRASL